MDSAHQAMGYDRAITMFSPDGRLMQVEYAKKTVKQGTTVVGLVCSDGVVVVSDKRIFDKLIVSENVEKIFQIDDHIAAAVSGLVSDGRVLIENAQVKSQQHKVTYDLPIDTMSLVKSICDLKQICTQSGGLRPFGVSLLIVGVDDDGPKLFITEPSGIYFQYYAASIGEGSDEATEVLMKDYKKTLNVDQGIALGIKALKEALKNEFKIERVEVAVIKSDEKKYRKCGKDEVKKCA